MKFMGHRGAKNERPENTILGIEYALGLGVETIEIDIHQSRDGELVVIHDETLERTTNGLGPVRNKTIDELRQLDAGEGQKIPLLGEVIQTVKAFKAKLFIEVKAKGLEEKLYETIVNEDYLEQSCVICFDHLIVQKMKELNKNLETACLIYARPIRPAQIIQAAGADGLSVDIRFVDKELVKDCHDKGFHVTTWNLNDPSKLEYYQNMGIDYLGTDNPSLFLRGPLAGN